MSTEVKKIKGKIDGREIEVPEGTTILKAAGELGIEIPHFCYHPSIGIEGSCRMCLVEVKDNPKLQISCAVPLSDGMEVMTDTEKVKEGRKGVLEFLLINHPLDCPICDKGGECPLQDYSFSYGAGRSRFEEEKRKLPKHKILSDHIIFDSERCILCSRCVRFYRDITGTHELIIKKRGHKSEIAAFDEKPLKNEFSGNLADICPVGALTTRDFRFQARPWELKTYQSACAMCSLNCSVQIWKDSNINKKNKEIRRITPTFNEKVNDCWLCDRGRFSFHELLKSPRLKTPVIREENAMRPLSLEEAISELNGILGDLLDRTGRESFKVISSTDITNEEAWLLKIIAETSERAGTVLLDMPKSVFEFYGFLKERDLITADFTDIENSKNLVFLGTDLVKTHPVMYLQIRNLIEKGAKLIATGDFTTPDEKLVTKRIEGQEPDKKTLDKLAKVLADEKDITVFIDGKWFESGIVSDVQEFIASLQKRGELSKVVIARENDHNSFGIFNIASTHFGFSEEINALLESKSAKELLLIGDDLIENIFKDERFDVENFNFISMIKKFDDEHLKMAHLAFPQLSFIEKNGTLTNFLGTLQNIKKTIKVTEEPVQEWMVLEGLARGLGSKQKYIDEGEIFRAISRHVPGYPDDPNKIRLETRLYTHYNRELRK